MIDRYRIDVLPLKSPKTRRNEGDQLTKLKTVFGDMYPDAVTAQQLYRYADQRRRPDGQPAPEAARHELALLGHVYSKAIRWGAQQSTPSGALRRP